MEELKVIYKVVDEYENEFKTVGFSDSYEDAVELAKKRIDEMNGHADIVIYMKTKCGQFYPTERM